MRKDLERDERRKLEAARNELRKDLEAHDRSAQRKYEALLREYQRNVDRDVLDAKLEMDAKYREVLRSAREAERKWTERAQQMEEAARNLRNEAAGRERVGKNEAERALELAKKTRSRVGEMPHEFFFPKRLEIFSGAIDSANELHKTGLNEAAAAISVSTRFGIERLGYDVKEKTDEWVDLFALFRMRVGLLNLRLESEITDWVRFVGRNDVGSLDAEEIRRRATEIDYWSKGVYATTRRRVDELGALIAGIDRTGVTACMKSGSALDPETLKADMAETDRLSDALNGACDVYRARYSASCQRAQWGEAIVSFLTDEINLRWLEEESGFRNVDEALEDSTFKDYVKLQYGDESVTEDSREWLELAFENAAGGRVFLYIVPEEREREVHNKILLYVDGNGDGFAREIYLHVLESLQISGEDGVVTLLHDVAQLTQNSDMTLRSTGKALEEKLKGRRP
jgi:hypothetical protein